MAAMIPSLTLLADTTADHFPSLLQSVRQACDAVFDDPYRFEVLDPAHARKANSQPRPPVLIGEGPNLKRRITKLEDPEWMILQLIEFKNAVTSLGTVTEFLHRSTAEKGGNARSV